MNVTQIRTVSVEVFSLLDTYFVPTLTLNFVYIGQLCDHGLDIIFSSSDCHIQDPQTNKIIRTGRRYGRLFELTSLHLPIPKLSSSHLVGSFSSTTSIWHSRLGHPSSSRLCNLISSTHLGSVYIDITDCVSCKLERK